LADQQCKYLLKLKYLPADARHREVAMLKGREFGADGYERRNIERNNFSRILPMVGKNYLSFPNPPLYLYKKTIPCMIVVKQL
jgi:hypothetical protein